MRIKAQTLVPPVITMVLYLYIFGSIIGRKVGTIMDMPYIQFIGPGIVMALINNAYTNVSSSFFSSKNHRFYEEMFVTPVPSVFRSFWATYLAECCRGLLVMCSVSIVVYLFNPFDIHNIFVLLLAAITTAVIFSALGMINAI